PLSAAALARRHGFRLRSDPRGARVQGARRLAAGDCSLNYVPSVASVDELAGIPLFESLSDADLQEVASWFEERTADEGVRLIGEGAAGYSFFVLLDGSAAVTSGDTQLADLGPGDFFGE